MLFGCFFKINFATDTIYNAEHCIYDFKVCLIMSELEKKEEL